MNNKIKREIILACVIGDGCIYKSKINTYSLQLHHGMMQEDYLIWKTKMINSTNKIKFDRTVTKITKLDNKEYMQCVSIWNDTANLKIFYKWFYSNNSKTLKNILKYLNTELALAIWFMDNGSVFKRKRKHKDGSIYFLKPSMKLCTHSFNKNDNMLILKWLKEKFDIEGYIVIERKKNRPEQPEYFTLNFNAENTLKIWMQIKNIVVQIPSMRNKFDFLLKYYSNLQ